MTAAEIREYLARDWELIERVKTHQWIEQKAKLTPSAVFESGAALLEYARTVRPDWPNMTDRQADLDAHVRLADLLQRACRHRLC